jgi:hypothetical protein
MSTTKFLVCKKYSPASRQAKAFWLASALLLAVTRAFAQDTLTQQLFQEVTLRQFDSLLARYNKWPTSRAGLARLSAADRQNLVRLSNSALWFELEYPAPPKGMMKRVDDFADRYSQKVEKWLLAAEWFERGRGPGERSRESGLRVLAGAEGSHRFRITDLAYEPPVLPPGQPGEPLLVDITLHQFDSLLDHYGRIPSHWKSLARLTRAEWIVVVRLVNNVAWAREYPDLPPATQQLLEKYYTRFFRDYRHEAISPLFFSLGRREGLYSPKFGLWMHDHSAAKSHRFRIVDSRWVPLPE